MDALLAWEAATSRELCSRCTVRFANTLRSTLARSHARLKPALQPRGSRMRTTSHTHDKDVLRALHISRAASLVGAAIPLEQHMSCLPDAFAGYSEAKWKCTCRSSFTRWPSPTYEFCGDADHHSFPVRAPRLSQRLAHPPHLQHIHFATRGVANALVCMPFALRFTGASRVPPAPTTAKMRLTNCEFRASNVRCSPYHTQQTRFCAGASRRALARLSRLHYSRLG